MRVDVDHTFGDVARDFRAAPIEFARKAPGAVRRATRLGHATAQQFARDNSGPHGLNYYKRITEEALSPLVGEYGPTGTVTNNAVGAGWRSGPPNTDLEKSQDVMGPKFAKDVGDILDGLYS